MPVEYGSRDQRKPAMWFEPHEDHRNGKIKMSDPEVNSLRASFVFKVDHVGFDNEGDGEMQVRMSVEKYGEVWQGTVDELIAANEFSGEELNDLLDGLRNHGVHNMGGGAAPIFIIEEVKQ